MKTKELEQLRNKADAELLSDVKKSKDKLWEMQVDLRAGKLKNVSDIRKTKKLIAAAQTILTERKNSVKADKKD